MSNERDFENRDARVSEAYRQTAQERAPESLNQAVLGMASGKAPGRPSGIMFAGWVKPVAWAATIGLSLTIVLELTRTPVPMDAVVPAPASIAVESVRQDFERQENRAVEEARKLEQLQTGPNNQDVLEEIAVTDAASDDVAVADVVPNAVAEVDAVPHDVAVADDVPARTMLTDTVPEQAAAKEVAREKAFTSFTVGDPAPDQDSSVARSRMAGLVAPALETKESDSETDCDTKARSAADSWLLCIKKLRESGDIASAEREYTDFLLEHPDPEVHK